MYVSCLSFLFSISSIWVLKLFIYYQLKSSITCPLCNQIFAPPIHWPNFPETATHAINFGPGCLGGIGSLTARNLDGRGVRIIITYHRLKG